MTSSETNQYIEASEFTASCKIELIDSDELRQNLLNSAQKFKLAIASGNKNEIRLAHQKARLLTDYQSVDTLQKMLNRRKKYFIDGKNLQPSKISPTLIEVGKDQWSNDIFRLARSTWSMPHSKGYGRRLRYLVMDEYHESLIGVIGLQSPPIDLKCRDDLVSTDTVKLDWVNSTLDAFTLGAIPPYRSLLGGKLVAGYLSTIKIQQDYWRKYGAATTIISRKRLKQPLIGITTASAFGRSSIYNRLKYKDLLLAKPLGYTRGYGTIHLEEFYPTIVEWLRQQGKLIPSGFGHGPKIRWQNLQNAIQLLGLPNDFLSHGLSRQVFLFSHVENFGAAASGNLVQNIKPIQVGDWSDYWHDRYCMPRHGRISHECWHNSSGIASIEQAISSLRTNTI